LLNFSADRFQVAIWAIVSWCWNDFGHDLNKLSAYFDATFDHIDGRFTLILQRGHHHQVLSRTYIY